MNKKLRISIIAALVVVFIGAIVLREGQRRSTAQAGTPGTSGAVAAGVTQPHDAGPAPGAGQPTSAQPLPRLVDLGSTTCVPCKMMAPILEELGREYQGRLIVEVIDVRTSRSTAELYGIRVIPTQIFFDATGKERFRHEGFMDKQAILDKWKELGVTF